MSEQRVIPQDYADVEPDDVRAFQRAVGDWAEQTFTQSSRDAILAHLSDEVAELVDAEHENYASENQVMEEAADCYLLLLRYAHVVGFSLQDVAATKFIRNTRRRWGTPDHRGVVRHVGQG